jgi:hypothetical protein
MIKIEITEWNKVGEPGTSRLSSALKATKEAGSWEKDRSSG